MPGKDTAIPTDCQERKKQKEKKLLKMEHILYFKQVSEKTVIAEALSQDSWEQAITFPF